MKLNYAAICSSALLALAAAAAPAFAGPLMWNFYSLGGSPTSNKNLGVTSTTFTQGTESLTTTSMMWNSSTSTWGSGNGDLVIKAGGSAEEEGMGLSNDPYPIGSSTSNDEIAYPNGIEVSGFSGHVSDVMIGSIQGTSTNGESWAVYGSNNGSSWTQLGSGMGGLTESFNSASLMDYSHLIISDPSSTPYTNSNDVVLMSVTTVPEPGTLALFAAGLLGCALLAARRRRARQR